MHQNLHLYEQHYLLLHVQLLSISENQIEKKLKMNLKLKIGDKISRQYSEIQNSFQLGKEYVYRLWGAVEKQQAKLIVQVLLNMHNQVTAVKKIGQKSLTFQPTPTCERLSFDMQHAKKSYRLLLQFRLQSNSVIQNISQISRTRVLEEVKEQLQKQIQKYRKQQTYHQQLLAYTDALVRELEKEANKLTTEVDEVDMTGNSLERIIVLPLKRSKANRLIHRASVNYILDENKGEIVKSSTTGKPTMDQLIKQVTFRKPSPGKKQLAETQYDPRSISSNPKQDASTNTNDYHQPSRTQQTNLQSTHHDNKSIVIMNHGSQQTLIPSNKSTRVVNIRISRIFVKIYKPNLTSKVGVRIQLQRRSYHTKLLSCEGGIVEWTPLDQVFKRVDIVSIMQWIVMGSQVRNSYQMLKKNTEEKLGTCSVTVEDLEEYKDTKSYKAYLSKMNSIVGFLRFDYRFEESTVRNSEVVLERLQLPAITKGMIDGSPCRKGSQWRSKSQINEVQSTSKGRQDKAKRTNKKTHRNKHSARTAVKKLESIEKQKRVRFRNSRKELVTDA